MHILNPILNNIEKQLKTEGAILVGGRLCIVERGDSISMGGDFVPKQSLRGRLCYGKGATLFRGETLYRDTGRAKSIVYTRLDRLRGIFSRPNCSIQFHFDDLQQFYSLTIMQYLTVLISSIDSNWSIKEFLIL